MLGTEQDGQTTSDGPSRNFHSIRSNYSFPEKLDKSTLNVLTPPPQTRRTTIAEGQPRERSDRLPARQLKAYQVIMN